MPEGINQAERLRAVLDIGSNSVRLLVAGESGGQFFPYYANRIVSRLFEGLKDGALKESSLERTLRAILTLAEDARRHGAESIEAFGTSALRDGYRNRQVLIDRAAAVGVPVRVLSGEEEARLAYAGAAPSGQVGVIDIGGGSTEMMTGADGKVRSAASARMGAVRLQEMANGRTDADKLFTLARDVIGSANAAVLRQAPRDGWIGVGGTFTALAAMEQGLDRYESARIQGFLLMRSAAFSWMRRLCGMTQAQRLNIPGLIAERADIIPFGAAIAAACFDLTCAEAVSISDRDNLLGFLALYAHSQH